MSFHDGDSEVSRLNRDACKAPVQVSDATYAVIAHAQAISALTEGAFDITVAPLLVARGHLPCPAHAPNPMAAPSGATSNFCRRTASASAVRSGSTSAVSPKAMRWTAPWRCCAAMNRCKPA